MKLPDKVTVTCQLCGAAHTSDVTYTEEVRDNAITFRVHAALSPEFTAHVARVHLMVDGLPQVLTPNGAESSDDADAERGAGDGSGAKTVIQVLDVEELKTTTGRERLDLILDGDEPK